MDWHHPDGARCATDEAARRRFLDFTQGCVRELCTNYGKIDILWYDVSWPLQTPELWESAKMNAMVRELQPDIIINNRSQLPEDFGTPEEHITAAERGPRLGSVHDLQRLLGLHALAPSTGTPCARCSACCARARPGQGNLLLNIGPTPDGSVPDGGHRAPDAVGKWPRKNGEAIYGRGGPRRRTHGVDAHRAAGRSRATPPTSGATAGPGSELAIGGLRVKVHKASFLDGGKPIAFEQTDNRLVLKGLPTEARQDRRGHGDQARMRRPTPAGARRGLRRVVRARNTKGGEGTG